MCHYVVLALEIYSLKMSYNVWTVIPFLLQSCCCVPPSGTDGSVVLLSALLMWEYAAADSSVPPLTFWKPPRLACLELINDLEGRCGHRPHAPAPAPAWPHARGSGWLMEELMWQENQNSISFASCRPDGAQYCRAALNVQQFSRADTLTLQKQVQCQLALIMVCYVKYVCPCNCRAWRSSFFEFFLTFFSFHFIFSFGC